MPHLFVAKSDYKIWRGPLDLGAKSKVGWLSNSRRDISETVRIELRWQLITNSKSYMGFQLQHKSITWMTLLFRQFYVCCDQIIEARITRISLSSSTLPQVYACLVWWRYSGGPLIWGLKIVWGGFLLRGTISWRLCEIQLRSQLNTNRRSCI